MSELIKRLRQLAKAVTEGQEGWHREFTMRVPAEPERDADLVISTAADAIAELTEQRDELQRRYDSAVRLLTGIHALLYPAPIEMPDGRTMVFRPKNPDPHIVLQELIDRIRALPDELEAIAKAEKK